MQGTVSTGGAHMDNALFRKNEKTGGAIVDYKRELVYSNGAYSVIKCVSMYGISYSVVRFGSAHFEQTFDRLILAIDWCEVQKAKEKEGHNHG